MGLVILKPYQKLCRATGKWIWVQPEPIDLAEKKVRGNKNGSPTNKMIHIIKFLTI